MTDLSSLLLEADPAFWPAALVAAVVLAGLVVLMRWRWARGALLVLAVAVAVDRLVGWWWPGG